MNIDKKWIVLGAITFVYVFLNISAFNTLGVVLKYMISDLGWSNTDAGMSYTVLGVACGLGSLLPIYSLKKYGVRLTVTVGCILLLAGFVLSVVGTSILSFYAAMSLVGVGFAMSGNIPAVWIIGAWFSKNVARMVGLYMMAGAGGSIIGPPLVQFIVATFGWKFHLGAMAVIAAMCLVLAVVAIAEGKGGADAEDDAANETPAKPDGGVQISMSSEWTYAEGLRTPAFALTALAITLLLVSVTTISAVGVIHLTMLGSSDVAAAWSLGFFALIGTAAKGFAGPLCDWFSARRILSFGTLAQGFGLVLFAQAEGTAMLYVWGLVFGMGWGMTYVASTVILLEFFGHETGSRLFAATHFFATVAAFGPLAAGWTADQYGTFAPAFYVLSVAYVIAAGPILWLKKPGSPPSRALAPAE